MSLRLRLLLALIALTAVGLLVAAFVSRSALKSYLYDRVDQQVEDAVMPGLRLLALREFTQRIPPGALPVPSPEDPASQLPPGTFVQLRDARGRAVRGRVFSYGEANLPRPDLSSGLPLNRLSGNPSAGFEVSTVGARSGGGEFRVAALAPPDGSGSLIVAVPLSDAQDTLARLTLIEAIVTAAVLAALAALAWWVLRIGLRPLEEMEQTAGEIAAGDLSRRVEPSTKSSEVGRLGLALNAMLGQIEEAFAQRKESEDRMRRFLADASHELRTPLSSIRGYAEVFRIGAASEPEEVERAMRRIEQESERMSGLVNDLLTLARLDEVREPLREPVNLAELVGEACDDARAVSPDRAIALIGPGSIELLGDRDQLHQVVANLLRNAAMHTPAGTPIEVSLERADATATLRVRDHGPGLPDGVGDLLFERFWRRGEARARNGGGAGLGLAIVSAIVSAHGGEVHAASAADAGAEFTVSLPLGGGTPASA
jgi:two-component system OmpR family sensor kinase